MEKIEMTSLNESIDMDDKTAATICVHLYERPKECRDRVDDAFNRFVREVKEIIVMDNANESEEGRRRKKRDDDFVETVETVAVKYAKLVEAHIDAVKDEPTSMDLLNVYREIQTLGQIAAKSEIFDPNR